MDQCHSYLLIFLLKQCSYLINNNLSIFKSIIYLLSTYIFILINLSFYLSLYLSNYISIYLYLYVYLAWRELDNDGDHNNDIYQMSGASTLLLSFQKGKQGSNIHNYIKSRDSEPSKGVLNILC